MPKFTGLLSSSITEECYISLLRIALELCGLRLVRREELPLFSSNVKEELD
jgi:hypothetical protein